MTQTLSRTTLGILFMLAFCILAPMMDSFAKATPHEVPVTQILAARFALQVIFLYPVALALRIPMGIRTADLGMHFGRAFALLASTFCFFTALRYMPLADAISIFFVEPFILMLLGAVFLGEPVGWRRVAAAGIGFGGALLVIRPSFTDLGLVALLPLATAFLFALYMLLTRAMSQRLHTIPLQAHTALAACLLILPPLWYFDGSGTLFDPVWPQGKAVWTLLGLGITATLSHLMLTRALNLAPAGVVAPLQYLEIVGATLIGYFAFGDLPTPLTFLGIAIIIVSGLYIIHRERRLEREATPPTPPV